MSFKKILIHRAFWRPLCLVEQNHLCNFGRGHYGEPSCEVILNLDQWFRRRCHLKKRLWTDARQTKTDHNSSPEPKAKIENYSVLKNNFSGRWKVNQGYFTRKNPLCRIYLVKLRYKCSLFKALDVVCTCAGWLLAHINLCFFWKKFPLLNDILSVQKVVIWLIARLVSGKTLIQKNKFFHSIYLYALLPLHTFKKWIWFLEGSWNHE